MGSHNELPVRTACESVFLITQLDRVPQFTQSRGNQVTDLMKKVVADRTAVEREAEVCGFKLGGVAHPMNGGLAQRFGGRLFLEAQHVLVIVPALFVVADKPQVRQRGQLAQRISR